MHAKYFFWLALLASLPTLGGAQVEAQSKAPGPDIVSSDDISVADGLQLPDYGHIWLLDTWKGVHELIRLQPTELANAEWSLTGKTRRTIEVKGEASTVRIHESSPQIFVRGVSGDDDGPTRSNFALVRLNVERERREAAKNVLSVLTAEGKGNSAGSADVVELMQRRIGVTNWYRVWANQTLTPGEYAIVPVPGKRAPASEDIYDFAVDPGAPENRNPLRSEENRQSSQ
jgi:hypothetical protein